VVTSAPSRDAKTLANPRQAANILQVRDCGSFHPPAFSLYQRHGLCTRVTWLSLIHYPVYHTHAIRMTGARLSSGPPYLVKQPWKTDGMKN